MRIKSRTGKRQKNAFGWAPGNTPKAGWNRPRFRSVTLSASSTCWEISSAPQTALAHLSIDQQGFAWLPEDDFVHHFAADVDPVKARVMYAVQQPLSWSALGDVMGVPAWKALPSWFLVADGDQTIPPDAERLFARRMEATTVEVKTNHVAMVSHPDDVLKLIETAAQAVLVAR